MATKTETEGCKLIFCKTWVSVLAEKIWTQVFYILYSEQRNILHEIRKQKANWIGHILRRNCLLKRVIEGKIKGEMEVTRRR